LPENVLDNEAPVILASLGREPALAVLVGLRRLAPEVGSARLAYLMRVGFAVPVSGRMGRMPFAAPMLACDYYALVSRMEKRPRADFWPIRLREPLPLIPVPLRPPDADAQLDLQAVLHHIYDAARYGQYIYEEAPQPALRAADETWAQQFIPPRS